VNDLKFVEIYGERLAYREAGCGEVVVLLHGVAGSSQTWRPIIPQLAKRHRVIAPDLLGHGPPNPEPTIHWAPSPQVCATCSTSWVKR
jgi:pimeloyl-ACP methyl ester carboxylesterase